MPAGDRASYLGFIDIGVIADLGSTCFVGADNIGKQVKLLSDKLYGLLVTIGAYTVVRSQVRIGEGTTIGPHCVIEGRTTIGRDNRFFPFSSIGAMPQDISHGGEVTQLVIGDRNTVREFCTLNVGTVQDRGETTVGNDNWIMAYCHIAHDCPRHDDGERREGEHGDDAVYADRGGRGWDYGSGCVHEEW